MGQQHVTRARAVAAAQKQKEAADLGTKKQNIDRQLQEAQDRREAFLAEKIAPAERANLQVQSVANEQSNLLREKRAALEQKQKDATARRNVAESHKARHTPSKHRPGSPTNNSPPKGAGGGNGNGSFFGRQPRMQQPRFDEQSQQQAAAPPAAPEDAAVQYAQYQQYQQYQQQLAQQQQQQQLAYEQYQYEQQMRQQQQNSTVVVPERLQAALGRSLLRNLWG